ncbi:carbon-nitrogen hydrolase family protein [Streptomyces virginiae]|uniref:carbon-nitrogen hydrolase family protein n=1 Tax=Streptomyces virginiae TaxID=1961 RepID=UPI0036ACEF56
MVPADWSHAAWDVLREEAESITALAGELGLWTVFGSIHPLTPPNRPHNSLYIVSDQGRLVARYDKRFLSHTEVSFLYVPGREPLVFEVNGIRIGCALCVEGYSVPAQFSATVPSGIVGLGGRWLARCPADGRPALAIADIDLDSKEPDIDVVIRYARPWRRSARAGLYGGLHATNDPRSENGTAF